MYKNAFIYKYIIYFFKTPSIKYNLPYIVRKSPQSYCHSIYQIKNNVDIKYQITYHIKYISHLDYQKNCHNM